MAAKDFRRLRDEVQRARNSENAAKCDLFKQRQEHKKRTARLEAELEQMRKLLVGIEIRRPRQVFIGVDPAAEGLDELGITFTRKRKG